MGVVVQFPLRNKARLNPKPVISKREYERHTHPNWEQQRRELEDLNQEQVLFIAALMRHNRRQLLVSEQRIALRNLSKAFWNLMWFIVIVLGIGLSL
jgi:hypothetical protein